jgi:hypothetical protein
MAIAARQQRLKDLLRRHSDLGCDGFRSQVFRVNFVFAQFVLHAQAFQQADGIRFHLYMSLRSNPRSISVHAKSLLRSWQRARRVGGLAQKA